MIVRSDNVHRLKICHKYRTWEVLFAKTTITARSITTVDHTLGMIKIAHRELSLIQIKVSAPIKETAWLKLKLAATTETNKHSNNPSACNSKDFQWTGK